MSQMSFTISTEHSCSERLKRFIFREIRVFYVVIVFFIRTFRNNDATRTLLYNWRSAHKI